MSQNKLNQKSTAIAACAFSVSAAASIQLLPAGKFRASDGRPHEVDAWHIDAAIAAKLIAEFSARANRTVIDYEHQTLLSAENGKPSPAAGWFKTLEWREGDGLYATDVKWTQAAARMIENEEYLYISPVFAYDASTGDVSFLLNAALTNDPALDGMSEVTLMAASRLININKEPETMPKEEELLAQISAKDVEIAALKAAKPDPAKYVPVETMQDLQSQVAALTAEKNERAVNDAVVAALGNGKLLPAQEAWARDLGKTNLVALTAYLETAQPIAALSGTQTDGKSPEGKSPDALTDDQLALCKQMGVSVDVFKKTLADKAAI